MEKTFEIGNKNFVLDQDKAEEAFAAKAVINGRQIGRASCRERVSASV